MIPAHDPYGCSNAARWTACPGSIKMCEGLPDASSDYANEGTAAHEVVAQVLSGHKMPEWVELCNRCSSRFGKGSCPNCGGREYRLDRDMPVYCQRYVDYVLALKDSNYVHHFAIETRMQSSRWPQHGGTVDCYIIYQDSQRRTWLHVIDLKYGRGVEVDADDNHQLKCYLNLARERHPNIKHFRATIVQPRIGDGLPETIEVSRAELDALDFDILSAMLSDELVAGSHCRWCPAAVQCPAVLDHAKEMAQQEFDTIEPAEEDIEKLVSFFKLMPALRKLINEVPRRMLHLMQQGKEIPGFKPVASLGYRQWNLNEEDLIAQLIERDVPPDQIYKRTLNSPAQIEKIAGKKVTVGLTFRPMRGYSVAPVSDKRPAVDLTGAEFDELQEEFEDA